MLSGFVLAHTYLYREEPISTLNFICRRLARLYPFHLITLLLFLGLSLGLGWGLPDYIDGTLATFLQQLTLTQNIGLNPNGLTWNYPSWSVSVEFWVNILFILFVSRTTHSMTIFLVALVGLIVIYINTGHLETQVANYYGYLNSGMLRGLSGFLLGVLAYRIYLRVNNVQGWLVVKTPLEITAVATVMVVIFAREEKVSSLDFFAPFVFIILVVSFADESGFLSRRLRRLAYLGTISYSIYLNQIIVGHLVWRFVPALRDTFYFRLTVFLVVLLVVSHFTYMFVEKPMRNKIKGKRCLLGKSH